MSTAKLIERVSTEAYLASEKTSPIKHEYVHGRLYAQAGASDRHNRITVNLVAKLYAASLAKGCQLYASDMKLRTEENVFYYPDLMVVKDDTETYFKTQPCLVAEVLSPSTATTDRREKLEAYLRVPTLMTYLLIEAQEPYVEGYYRTPEGWLEQRWEGGGDVCFACLETSLSFEAIYFDL